MKRLLFVFFICSCFCFKHSAQKLRGLYYGKYQNGISEIPDTISWLVYPIYDSIKLNLKRKGKFLVSYNKWVNCPTNGNSRFCSGNYEVIGDTIHLRSKYNLNKFYHIDYYNSMFQNGDSLLLIISAQHWSKTGCLLNGHPITLATDYGLEKRIDIGESIWIDNRTKIIQISMDCPTDMDWYVKLNEKMRKNTIKLDLLCGIGKENISIENVTLLIKKDTLYMLDNFNFLEIKDRLFIKNNR